MRLMKKNKSLLRNPELERVPSKSPHLRSIKLYRTDNRIRIADASPTLPAWLRISSTRQRNLPAVPQFRDKTHTRSFHSVVVKLHCSCALYLTSTVSGVGETWARSGKKPTIGMLSWSVVGFAVSGCSKIFAIKASRSTCSSMAPV